MRTRYFDKNNFVMEKFLEDMDAYQKGMGEPPLLIVKSILNGQLIEVVIEEPLIRMIRRKPYEYTRDISAVLTYGYVGYSKGGKNGIANITKRDQNLQREFNRFIDCRRGIDLLAKYGIKPQSAFGVKVVVHRKNGRRIMGTMEKDKPKIILFEEGFYKK